MTLRIIMIGFMGSGKTTIGKLLADRLQLPFLDTDELIEQQQKRKISKIFAEEGEMFFRDLETQTLRDLSARDDSFVLSAGGGLPVRKENRELMKQMGNVVFLQAGLGVLEERLKNDSTRPLLQGTDLRARIQSLMQQREALYLDASTICVRTDNRSFDEILDEIREKTVENHEHLR